MAQDVVRPSAVCFPIDPVIQARRRVEEQRAAVGDRHPDYASSLIQLALLLIMHGQPAEAEPLLREALDVRKELLGERHPDYATCLSSLAGLLWARGDLDGAESLLRQALEIRTEVLSERHPKSVVSRNSLEQLLQAKNRWARPQARPEGSFLAVAEPPPPVPGAAVARPGHEEPAPAPEAPAPSSEAPADSEEPASPPEPPASVPDESPIPAPLEALWRALEGLRADFVALGERLTRSAPDLQTRGLLPGPELLRALQDGRDRFRHACGRALHLAGSAGVPGLDQRPLNHLHDLEALVHDIEQAEAERARHGAPRARALGVLNRVLDLEHADQADFPALCACQAQARALAESLSATPPPGPAPDAVSLAEGRHPFSALLALAGGPRS